jgi:hypothetical protein
VIAALVVGVVVVAVAGWLVWQRQRTQQLHARYGTEYERTVVSMGRRRAEAELKSRERRVKHLDIRPLTIDQRDAFARLWRDVQAKFVDDPKRAVTQGDVLVEEVMKARGYPIADFDQRVADLSVHHARVVENYRAARDIAALHRRGEANTEDLRQAMVYYRELFEDLLEDREGAVAATERVVERPVERDTTVESITDRVNRRRPPDSEVRS